MQNFDLGVAAMSYCSLPADDLPPAELSESDRLLHHQLEDLMTKYFYESCDGVTQGLLLRCNWHVISHTDALLLEIHCPDMMTNWRVLNNVVPLSNLLKQLVPSAKVRICPPENAGTPFEVRVDEVSIYRDLL